MVSICLAAAGRTDPVSTGSFRSLSFHLHGSADRVYSGRGPGTFLAGKEGRTGSGIPQTVEPALKLPVGDSSPSLAWNFSGPEQGS